MKRIFVLSAFALLAACSTHPVSNHTANVESRAAATTSVHASDVTALQGLTRILIDSTSLYTAAAEDSSNEAYAAQLRTLATSRTTMTDRFQSRVATLGGAPAETGQALGTAHRVLMEARTLGDQDTKVAVQEALRGEQYLLDQMTEEAGNAHLTAETRAFISTQIPLVTTDRDRFATYARSLG